MNITILLNIHHVDLALQYAGRVVGIRQAGLFMMVRLQKLPRRFLMKSMKVNGRGGSGMSIYDKIFPPKKLVLSNGKTVLKPASRLPLIALILVFFTALSVKITGFDLGVLRERGSQFLLYLE